MDANVSTMTMPKTMPVQNLCRYISFKTTKTYVEEGNNPLKVLIKCESTLLQKTQWGQSISNTCTPFMSLA